VLPREVERRRAVGSRAGHCRGRAHPVPTPPPDLTAELACSGELGRGGKHALILIIKQHMYLPCIFVIWGECVSFCLYKYLPTTITYSSTVIAISNFRINTPKIPLLRSQFLRLIKKKPENNNNNNKRIYSLSSSNEPLVLP
jgi:hypothetical protein